MERVVCGTVHAQLRDLAGLLFGFGTFLLGFTSPTLIRVLAFAPVRVIPSARASTEGRMTYRLWLRSPSRLRLRCFRPDDSLPRSRSLSFSSGFLLLLLLRFLYESVLSLDRSRRRSRRPSSSEGCRDLSRPINDGGWGGGVSVGSRDWACSLCLSGAGDENARFLVFAACNFQILSPRSRNRHEMASAYDPTS